MKRTKLDNPITIRVIENRMDERYCLDKPGTLVAVRPCGEEYEKKTYLGVMLGDLVHDVLLTAAEGSVLRVAPFTNPAMFVPTLRKVVFGYESWWHRIDTPDELKQITDDDIDAQWYVKIFKAEFKPNGDEENA